MLYLFKYEMNSNLRGRLVDLPFILASALMPVDITPPLEVIREVGFLKKHKTVGPDGLLS